MRRIKTILAITCLLLLLVGCSNNSSHSYLLSKEGVEPYPYSESDKFVLHSLGITGDANIILFKAPKAAKSMKVNVYDLNKNKTWDVTGGIEVFYAEELSESKRLEGTFSMLLKDKYAIDFYVDTKGIGSFKSEPLIDEGESVASAIGYLTDFQKIELNKEIPVAMIVLNKASSMKTHSLEDFFNPSTFDDGYITRYVTLNFSN